MQNLTARYNYIYNANIILEDYVSELHNTFANDYNEVLPVHLSPQKFDPTSLPTNPNDKVLDEIVRKSRTIITDKSLSNYLDEAYLLMGKSEFYKGNYFLAAEYFDYVAKTYPKNQPSLIQALDWQARSLMQVNELKTAAIALDSLEKHLEQTKNNRAEPIATLAQMALLIGQQKEAIPYLEAAVRESKLKRNTIRWHFILGQLYQEQEDYPLAITHYKKVQSSNTGFELYFNARLNLVEVNALQHGNQLQKEAQLLALLKDEKNGEFINQIYYRIAEHFRGQQSYIKATDYYKKAIEAAKTNLTLKGLAYLQLAELSITQQRDYLQAKKYYDAAILSLPKTYPGLELIQKKSQSLDYLSSRYELISTEDSLQVLAALPEVERENRARSMLFPLATDTTAITGTNTIGNSTNLITAAAGSQQQNGTFYFQNRNAIERGYTDFIKRWGNRKLEDNWRQSIRTTAPNTQQTLSLDPITQQPNDDTLVESNADSLKLANYLAAVPVNDQLLRASNEKIVSAYIELASFYEQELKASKDAAAIYEMLLKKYPENSQLAAINYSLYRIYNGLNQNRAESYKNQVLNNHSSSIYARIILEPNFRVDQNMQELEISNTYNNLFEIYLQKDFPKVIGMADETIIKTPQTKLAPQFAYLKAIAVGRTQAVDSLLQQFEQIKSTYPQDRLIVPLVNEHLSYINAHLAEFKKRKVALIDFDPNEPRFIAQMSSNPTKPTSPDTNNITQNTKDQAGKNQTAKDQLAQAKDQTSVALAQSIPENIQSANKTPFRRTTSGTWYFVIDVEDASIRLSSSRFGIGQFSRGNYPESDLRHQLVEFDNDQLIYVGNFSNFEAAKAFQDRITPQLNRIMRVSPTLYKTFIISKENFEIIKSKSLLNQYLEFYKNTN